jgi:hypothetical protein
MRVQSKGIMPEADKIILLGENLLLSFFLSGSG